LDFLPFEEGNYRIGFEGTGFHFDNEKGMGYRKTPINMSASQFKEIGHRLVDDVAQLLESFSEMDVAPDISPAEVRNLLPVELPINGTDAKELIADTMEILKQHSTFNGHPRFWGYITAGATPIGILADMLAAGINPNVGGWQLSPAASEIEGQTIAWLAQMIGYPTDCGGIIVSGGNMANFVGFLAGRRAILGEEIRKEGIATPNNRFGIYVSDQTHTWIQKAADFFGHGTNSITWVETEDQRMIPSALESAVEQDLAAGIVPMMVVGTAGSVSTGAVDPLTDIAAIAKKHKIWFHVDGAYGAFAAMLPEAPEDLKALSKADSVALDPHKWLYAPLEAGCTLVRNQEHLLNTFSYRPDYYHFDGNEEDPRISFYQLGPQNSRGFKALKVWLAIRQAGRKGYEEMIREDIRLAKIMYDLFDSDPDFEAITHQLSITTFRFKPQELDHKLHQDDEYLNDLNTRLLEKLQQGGEAFVSNAVINGVFALRACIVNFRTSEDDVRALPDIIRRQGRAVLETGG